MGILKKHVPYKDTSITMHHWGNKKIRKYRLAKSKAL